MFSRRPGARFGRRNAAFRGSSSEWHPFGFGESLLLDVRVDDGIDIGLQGVTRAHDLSGFSNHLTMTDSASLQPYVRQVKIDSRQGLTFVRDYSTRLLAPTALATALSGLNHPFTLAVYGAPGLLTTNGVFFSLGHSTGAAGLNIQWPRVSGSPSGAIRAVRSSDAGGNTVRTAGTIVTATQRLLNITFDGAVLGGAIGDSPDTMVALDWDNPAFAPAASSAFDWATFGCNRNAANPTGASPWSGAVRRIGIWDAAVPAESLDEWNERVML